MLLEHNGNQCKNLFVNKVESAVHYRNKSKFRIVWNASALFYHAVYMKDIITNLCATELYVCDK